MNNLPHALKYLAKGFSIIPCNAQKKPVIKSWLEFQARRPTEDEIKAWWKKTPSANIGIVTGKISGLTVVDCDSPEAWELLQEYLPDAFQAPVVLTPSGNKQIYFKHRPGLHSQNAILEKIDLKTDGGYVIAPPSACKYEKPKGTLIEGSHRWQAGDRCGLPEMPATLADELERLQVFLGGSAGEPSNASSFSFSHSRKNTLERDRENWEGVEGQPEPLATQATHSHVSHNLFDEGRRDNDLFHTANCLVKGGMPLEEIAQVLEKLIISWGEKPDQKWVNEKIKSAMKRAENRERNISAEVRELALATHGHFLATEMHSIATLATREQKRAANETLRRMVAEGLLEHSGTRNGQYRLIQTECDDIDFLNADDRALNFWLPFGLNSMAETMPGNIIVIAGVPNAGKTAFLLNIARYNWERFKVNYYSSEMGESELKKRLKNFDGTTLQEWHEHVKFKERSSDFADVIKPGAGIINIIDFLELHENFYEVGKMLADIHRKLKDAVAVVAIQKNPGAGTGLGGWRGVEKPRLYLNIGTDNVCTILKAKNWATKENPNGKWTKYIIRDGCNLSQSGGWHEPIKN